MSLDDDCGHGELAAAWVLGTLAPEEAERFAAHLEACPVCQSEVVSLRRAADAMADAVPAAAPPPGLRRRIGASVRQEAELLRAAGGEPRTSRAGPPQTRRHRGAVLIVAAASSLALGVLIGSLLGGEEPTPVRSIPGEVRDASAGSGSRAEVTVRGEDARLVLSDIAPPPEGRIYQAWLEKPPNPPAPTGALFSIGPTGDATVDLPALGDTERLIVTSEPPRGSRTPTSPPVLTVPLPDS